MHQTFKIIIIISFPTNLAQESKEGNQLIIPGCNFIGCIVVVSIAISCTIYIYIVRSNIYMYSYFFIGWFLLYNNEKQNTIYKRHKVINDIACIMFIIPMAFVLVVKNKNCKKGVRLHKEIIILRIVSIII